ncbi:Solute carrier family 41 member 2 [Ceratobasidium sp. AG-Ba]|nr:Solute carrier family 41 member 2 [Ceratobasidium sp. AG-Ba]
MPPSEAHELAPFPSGSALPHDFNDDHDELKPDYSARTDLDDDLSDSEDAGVALLGHSRSNGSLNTTKKPEAAGASQVIKGIISETAPTLFLTVLGMMFTGELLQRVTHWRPMRTIDELFILIPMLNNLKGNLELVLSARLGTASHIGVLDRRGSRRALVGGSLALLQLQALCVSAVAAVVSFLLGLALPDTAVSDESTGDAISEGGSVKRWTRSGRVIARLVMRATHKAIKVPEPDRPKSGWRELIVVLATAMSSASLSGLLLGSFMCSIVVLCRRFKLDPDNIAPPLASCLGDLVTLTLTAVTSTLYFYTSGRSQTLTSPPSNSQDSTSVTLFSRAAQEGGTPTPTPASFPTLPFVITLLLIVAIPFVFKLASRLTFSRPLLRDGWTPLLVAMAIESGTGIVLDWYVGRYRGFGLLAVVMTGLPGSVGAVFVSRLGTELHKSEGGERLEEGEGGSPKLVSFTLFCVGLPVLLSYLVFVWSAGWLPLPFTFVAMFVGIFGIAVAAALVLAYYMTHQFWKRGLDPDAYCLPVHSALVDLIGQLLLVACYEMASASGSDVKISR